MSETSARPRKGAIFRMLRAREGWTQAETARRLGRTQPYWHRIENGRKPLTLDEIRSIAALFGENPDELAAKALRSE